MSSYFALHAHQLKLLQDFERKGGCGEIQGGWKQSHGHELFNSIRFPLTIAELHPHGMYPVGVYHGQIYRTIGFRGTVRNVVV